MKQKKSYIIRGNLSYIYIYCVYVYVQLQKYNLIILIQLSKNKTSLCKEPCLLYYVRGILDSLYPVTVTSHTFRGSSWGCFCIVTCLTTLWSIRLHLAVSFLDTVTIPSFLYNPFVRPWILNVCSSEHFKNNA